MKNIIKSLFLLLLSSAVLIACEKDENRVVFEGGTTPVLTASTTTPQLSFVDANKEALTLSWTNPEFKFNTGISSLNVSYELEIDTVGANFTNPKKYVTVLQSDLSRTFIASALNDIMLNSMDLAVSVPHQLEARISATLSNIAGNASRLTSNKVTFTATPYAIPPKVTVPFTGRLFIIGNATPGGDGSGWNNPVPVPSQEFTRVSPTLYELTIPLIGGKEYLLIPDNGSWSNKYAVRDKNASGLSEGGEFGYNLGDNIPAPATSGTYKITVNFQNGRFSVVKQ